MKHTDSQYALGIDIGGTKIAFVIVDASGKIYYNHTIPTHPEQGVADVITRIVLIVNTVSQLYSLIGIGIGCAGYVDSNKGMVVFAANLDWHNVPLKDLLAHQLQQDFMIHVVNDVDALLLGELSFGVAKNVQDVVFLAIGTGFGAAAVSGGQRILGARFASMEIGHLPITQNQRPCACGKRGCLETSLSGKGLIAAYHEYSTTYKNSILNQSPTITTSAIIEAMQTKDTLADVIRQELISNLAQTLIICQALLDPELYIIGGGLGRVLAPYILQDARRIFQDSLTVDVTPRVQLSTIEESAIGATTPLWTISSPT